MKYLPEWRFAVLTWKMMNSFNTHELWDKRRTMLLISANKKKWKVTNSQWRHYNNFIPYDWPPFCQGGDEWNKVNLRLPIDGIALYPTSDCDIFNRYVREKHMNIFVIWFSRGVNANAGRQFNGNSYRENLYEKYLVILFDNSLLCYWNRPHLS